MLKTMQQPTAFKDDVPRVQGVHTKVLVFTLGNEQFAVNIDDAKEVLELSRSTKVPYAPGFIVGAMNLRGEIITILDIRYFVGLSECKRVDEPKVIVTDVTGMLIGILVDTVTGTLDIPEDEIQKPLLTLDGDNQTHMKGQVQLADDILVLLDLRRVLNCEKINLLRGADAQTVRQAR